MNKIKTTCFGILACSISFTYAQPNFTYNDLPNIGDQDSLNHIPNYTHSGNLDTETGNAYEWDFSFLSFNPIFWAIDSVRVKTHPVSASFADANIEYFHQEASGNNLELYHYDSDTLYIHRTGGTVGGSAFSPPLASIAFPIEFNHTSLITEPIYFGATQTGERTTRTFYDGFGSLDLPGGQSYDHVFRVKSVTRDTTFLTGFTVTYTNYFWYIQGGDIPLLRIFKIDINDVSGEIFNVYSKKTPSLLTIDQMTLPSKIAIYPNPSSNFIVVNGIKPNQNYAIYDCNGNVVDKGIFPDNNRINIQKLNQGTYVLKTNNSRPVKFVKRE